MKGKNVIIGATAIFALSALALYSSKKRKAKSRTKKMANEGYELASDILFPNQEIKNKNLKFGPVLPV